MATKSYTTISPRWIVVDPDDEPISHWAGDYAMWDDAEIVENDGGKMLDVKTWDAKKRIATVSDGRRYRVGSPDNEWLALAYICEA